jgi:hypothetical protein
MQDLLKQMAAILLVKRHEKKWKFHPHFEDLKCMVIQWWSVLRAAYKHRKIEYYTIHDQVLGILDDTIYNQRDESDEHLCLTRKESDGNAS